MDALERLEFVVRNRKQEWSDYSLAAAADVGVRFLRMFLYRGDIRLIGDSEHFWIFFDDELVPAKLAPAAVQHAVKRVENIQIRSEFRDAHVRSARIRYVKKLKQAIAQKKHEQRRIEEDKKRQVWEAKRLGQIQRWLAEDESGYLVRNTLARSLLQFDCPFVVGNLNASALCWEGGFSNYPGISEWSESMFQDERHWSPLSEEPWDEGLVA